jgi:hypothetical protein
MIEIPNRNPQPYAALATRPHAPECGGHQVETIIIETAAALSIALATR